MIKPASPQASQEISNPHTTIAKSNFVPLDFSKLEDNPPRRKSIKTINDEVNSSFNKSQPPSTKGSETHMPKYPQNVVVPSHSRIAAENKEHRRNSSCPPVSILKKQLDTEESRPSLPRSEKPEKKGEKIDRHGRSTKIKFRKDIEDVKIIENWKHYNSENYQQTSCHCNVF